jgi:hypothetical protein
MRRHENESRNLSDFDGSHLIAESGRQTIRNSRSITSHNILLRLLKRSCQFELTALPGLQDEAAMPVRMKFQRKRRGIAII